MNKLLAKLFLLIVLFSKVYLQDIFVDQINISGLKSLKENILFINAGLYPKEKYDDINSNDKYDFGEPFVDNNSNGYYDNKGTYIRTGEEIKNAINGLWSLELFSDVQIYITDKYDSFINLEIAVKEVPLIDKIEFKGNKKIKSKILEREVISIKKEDRLLMNNVYTSIQNIKDEYIKKSYHNIQVEIQIDSLNDQNKKNILFLINEGSKIRINNIKFLGNRNFSKKDLIKNAFINLKEKKWLIIKSKFTNEEDFELEIENLYNFYNNKGFRDFRVIRKNIEYTDSGINIEIEVDEGNINFYNNFYFSGNIKFTDEELLESLDLKKNDEYNKLNFDLSVFNLNSKYYDAGYYFLSNNYEIMPLESDLIDVYFDINENSQTKVRKIIISGNSKTNDNVIRRELKIFPGDIFSMKKLRESYGEVVRLNYFNSIDPQISTVNNLSDKIDINFVVSEKETGRANFSMGYNEQYGLTGGGGFEFINFRGMGQVLSIDYTRGIQQQGGYSPSPSSSNNSDYESFSFSFREPSIKNTPISIGTSISHSEQGKNDNTYLKYDIVSDRLSLSLGRKFNLFNYLLRAGWTMSYRETKYYGEEDILLENFSENIIKNSGNQSYASRVGISITQRFSRDSRDFPDFPTKGTSISWSTTFSGDVLGGNENYHKNLLDFKWFTSLKQNKNFVQYQDFTLGVTKEIGENEYLPYSARFRMGGDGMPSGEMLRGYKNNSIYGYESSSGGKIMFKYSTELRYLLSNNPTAYVFVFGEAGNVWPDFNDFDLFNLKRSLGFGFRIYMPMLGILGYDYGYGFDSIDENTDEPIGWQGHIIFGMPLN